MFNANVAGRLLSSLQEFFGWFLCRAPLILDLFGCPARWLAGMNCTYVVPKGHGLTGVSLLTHFSTVSSKMEEGKPLFLTSRDALPGNVSRSRGADIPAANRNHVPVSVFASEEAGSIESGHDLNNEHNCPWGANE